MTGAVSDAPVERHPLPPFLPPQATVLMLGSFPPPRKRWCMEFFYPNRSNMMWEVFGLLFCGDAGALTLPGERAFREGEIRTLLQAKGIAIYDAACAVRRLQENASDKFLYVEERTDLSALLEVLPRCSTIACTGEKACSLVCGTYGVPVPAVGQWVECQVPTAQGMRSVRVYRMPSTSRAYPLPLAQKAEAYAKLFRSLHLLP